MDPGINLILCLHQHHIAEYHNHFRNSGERGLQNAWFLWCKEGFHWLQVSKISLYWRLYPGRFLNCFDIFRFGRCSNTFSAAGVSCTGEEGSVANCRWYLRKLIEFRKWSIFRCLYCFQTSKVFKMIPRKQSIKWLLSAPELFWRSRYISDCSLAPSLPFFENILIAACGGLLKSSSHLLKYFEIFQIILIAGCRDLAGPVLKDRGGPGSVASNRSSEMP